MLIAHLSDPHITTGALGAEPAIGLHRALGRALMLDPQPDCVVITGDLVDHGRPAEYTALREVIQDYPLPLHLAAGNHDDTAGWLDAFDALAPGHYTVDYPDATVVVLNSQVPGEIGGRLGDAQLSWLDTELSRRPPVPALVCLHHPPIEVGLPFMDSIRLFDGPALAEVVARHPHVIRVLAGHLHRTVTAEFAGSTLTVAPSTYRQTTADFVRAEPPGYLHEPTGFLLHRVTAAGCVSHLLQVSHAAAPVQGY